MAGWLTDDRLWRISPHGTAMAGAIAVFVCFLPILGQTLVAIILGLFFRVHLPILFGILVLGTPIATPPVFYASYRLGTGLLNRPLLVFPDDWDWAWLWQSLSTLWAPLWAGSLVAGLVAALILYIAIRLAWYWRLLRRWKRRARSKIAGDTR